MKGAVGKGGDGDGDGNGCNDGEGWDEERDEDEFSDGEDREGVEDGCSVREILAKVWVKKRKGEEGRLKREVQKKMGVFWIRKRKGEGVEEDWRLERKRMEEMRQRKGR